MIRMVLGRAFEVECSRPSNARARLSALNRIKIPARSKISVARLELLMRLSLSYRKQGVDLI